MKAIDAQFSDLKSSRSYGWTIVKFSKMMKDKLFIFSLDAANFIQKILDGRLVVESDDDESVVYIVRFKDIIENAQNDFVKWKMNAGGRDKINEYFVDIDQQKMDEINFPRLIMIRLRDLLNQMNVVAMLSYAGEKAGWNITDFDIKDVDSITAKEKIQEEWFKKYSHLGSEIIRAVENIKNVKLSGLENYSEDLLRSSHSQLFVVYSLFEGETLSKVLEHPKLLSTLVNEKTFNRLVELVVEDLSEVDELIDLELVKIINQMIKNIKKNEFVTLGERMEINRVKEINNLKEELWEVKKLALLLGKDEFSKGGFNEAEDRFRENIKHIATVLSKSNPLIW